MKKNFWLWAAAACFALAAVFEFVFVGYAMTVIAFGGLGLVILFYRLTAGWKSGAARPLRIAVTILLAIGFGCFAAAEIPVICGAHSDEDPGADYVIVMGAGVNGTEPSLSLRERLKGAKEYLDAYPDSVAIVSGCQGDNESVTEASVMAAWLQSAGIDPSRILLEEQARSSYENILYSLRIIESRGGDPTGRVAVVSSEYHLYRIRLIGRALGCEPVCWAGKTAHLSVLVNYITREAFGVWRIWVLGPG